VSADGPLPLRIGSGFDVHPFGDDEDRPLVLGGVEVPGAPGLAGHSDADVATHAVADALLGACALGDLGSRFGVDRPTLAGADSLQLLATVVADVAATGYRVGNLDLTIVAQRPRLAAHREAMRANLARVLQVAPGRVSVKATTTDHLGTIGRGEGVAAWATCTVVTG
jgi:2-C-methyl-D-erythritol 2,4-cyclodiphosphate synthase